MLLTYLLSTKKKKKQTKTLIQKVDGHVPWTQAIKKRIGQKIGDISQLYVCGPVDQRGY